VKEITNKRNKNGGREGERKERNTKTIPTLSNLAFAGYRVVSYNHVLYPL
jgi:hypothetical protein